MRTIGRRNRGTKTTMLVLTLALATCNDRQVEEPEEVFVASQPLGGYNFTDTRAWSQSPPSPRTVSESPQFIQIGFDDNFVASGMTWILNFLRSTRNPAGNGTAGTFDNALVRASFYHNTCYIAGTCGPGDTINLKESWRTAIVDGHELGVHTHTHTDMGTFTEAQANAEIDSNVDWLTRPYVAGAAPGPSSGLGATLASLEGFRAPFLSYNTSVFNQIKANGFTYDISVEEGWQLNADGTNYNWPYTLNSGSPGGTAVGKPTGNQTGLWELGAAPFVKPPSLGGGKIVGLDYNLFIAAGMTKAQALDTLKYTLDQRLASNRAPFFIGAHTQIYTDAVSAPATTAQQRREVIEEFITYALTKSAVRIVTAKNVITWMRNPVALGGVCTPETNAQFCSRHGKNCGSFSGTDNCGASRTNVNCGSCTIAGQTCGGGGTPNVCGTTGGTGDTTEGGTATGTGTACNTTNEPVSKAYDNLMSPGTQGVNWTKWCYAAAPSTTTPARTMYDFSGTTAHAINRYTITTANDAATRDPKNWTFQGCNGSCTVGSDTGWVTLNTQTNQFAGAARFQTNSYSFTNTTAYQQYRLRVTANNGDTARFQLAEIQMFAGVCTPESNATFCSRNGKNCGTYSGTDNCGAARTNVNCGTCTITGQTCGGGGVPNVCGGGGGSCSPTVASYTLARCNSTAVYNAKLYRCISQAAGVNGEPTGCGTAGVFCSNITPTDAAWGTTAWLYLQDCP